MHHQSSLAIALLLFTFRQSVATDSSTRSRAREKPPIGNILLIVADDLGWNDVDWHDRRLSTPNLRSLAFDRARGVRLNKAYVSQQCSPTRSALMTGYYPHHLGTQHGVFSPLDPSGVPETFTFLPEKLKEQGYATYMVGKWHLGYCNAKMLPTNRGFDEFLGYYSGAEDYYTHNINHLLKNRYRVFGYDFWDQNSVNRKANGSYSAEVFANATIDMLDRHKSNRSQPFFLYLAFQSVHSPLEVPEKYLSNCNQQRKDRRIYCGMVSALDHAIGRVVASLKRLNLYDNTTIFFTTDNGGQTLFGGSNWPLRGNKNTLFEGGTKAISFVHSPFVSRPGVRNGLFHVVDYFATIRWLAGSEKTHWGDGYNQWWMIQLGVRKRKQFIYNIYKGKNMAIRYKHYKLIAGFPGKIVGWVPPSRAPKKSDYIRRKQRKGKIWLFDLKADPHERQNVARNRPKVRRQLMRKLRQAALSEVTSVHKDADMAGDPQTHGNGSIFSGWCSDNDV